MSNRRLEFALLFDQLRDAVPTSTLWQGLRCAVWVSDWIMITSISGVTARLNRV